MQGGGGQEITREGNKVSNLIYPWNEGLVKTRIFGEV